MAADTPANVTAAFQQYGVSAAAGAFIVRWDEEFDVAYCFLKPARDTVLLPVQFWLDMTPSRTGRRTCFGDIPGRQGAENAEQTTP